MYHTGGRVPQSPMEGLTPASADDLPPLGELIVDDPFWRYLAGVAREGVAHLRVWTTVTASPGYLAVVTETGSGAWVTESAGRIWAVLAGRFGSSLVLLEHHPAPESGEGMETLDLVRIGADGSAHWSRVWPTPEENPVTPGWSCGWPLTGTRLWAGRRAGSTGARTRAAGRAGARHPVLYAAAVVRMAITGPAPRRRACDKRLPPRDRHPAACTSPCPQSACLVVTSS
jgi:hypothetical protein